MPRIRNISTHLPADFAGLVRVLPPATIRDSVDYDNTQEMIDALTSLPSLTEGQDHYLDTLTVLMHDYEATHEAIDTSDISAIDILKHLLEENDMGSSDLGRLLGERSLGSKILTGSRELSKAHIRILSRRFGVRGDLFL